MIVYMLTCACVDFWAAVLPHVHDAKGLIVHALHGRMKQRARDARLAAFRSSSAGAVHIDICHTVGHCCNQHWVNLGCKVCLLDLKLATCVSTGPFAAVDQACADADLWHCLTSTVVQAVYCALMSLPEVWTYQMWPGQCRRGLMLHACMCPLVPGTSIMLHTCLPSPFALIAAYGAKNCLECLESPTCSCLAEGGCTSRSRCICAPSWALSAHGEAGAGSHHVDAHRASICGVSQAPQGETCVDSN